MRKLSLKNLKLEVNDMLQRNQLKTVFGGYGGYGASSCSADCTKNGVKSTVTCTGTNCSSTDFVGCKSDTESKSCPSD